jgi:hypothetical protein
MRRIVVLLLLGLIGWWIYSITRPVRYAPGILVAAEPIQTEVPPEQTAPWQHGVYMVRPLARYDIQARLLSRKNYSNDEIADLCPIDFAVGWGPMTDQAVLDRIRVWQTGRFFFWEYHNPAPLPKEQIIAHASNMHLIPSTPEVSTALRNVRTGDIFRLKGSLVEATRAGLSPVRSSLSRTDTGKGACEVMWVESVEVKK